MSTPRSRTVRRRRLGSELRRLREAAKMTIEKAAEKLECSDSRISLIENGKQGMRPKAVREMAGLYGVTDPEQIAALEDLAKQANDKGWFAAGDEHILTANFAAYVDLEIDARELLAYSSTLVNGLLQTPDYARAVTLITLPDAAPEQVDRLVELRMGRHARIAGEQPLTTWFVLDEAAIRRPIGSSEIMKAQLSHLIELSERPNITIQTLPFSKGGHGSLDGPFTVLRFPDPGTDGDVVYTEGPAGISYLENVEHVRAMSARFDRLRVLAQDELESRLFLRSAFEEM